MPSSALKTMRRLLGYMLPLWRGIVLSVLLGLLTVGSSIGLMATSAWLISMASLQPSIAALGVSVVAVRFFGIARGVFRYLERLVSHDTTFRLLAEWRVRFYRAIEPLAPAGLTDARSGDLLVRALGDVDALQFIYLRAIAPLLVAFITALLVTALFGAFDALVALVMALFMLLAGAGLPLMAWRQNQVGGALLIKDRAELHIALVDHIQGMADSLIFGDAQAQLRILNESSRVLRQHEQSFSRLDGLQTALGVLVVNSAALAVLTVAIPRVDGIYLATLALAAFTAFEALTPLTQAAANLTTGLTAAQRLFDIVDQKPAIAERATSPAAPTPHDYGIEFEHVTFRYNSAEQPAFSDVSFAVKSGQRIAIIGESGAGKSTLVNVLLRFWEHEAGEIRLGGRNLREYAPTDLRQMIGVMTQRTYLFNTSVMENIRLARPAATDAEVMQAAKRAQVHDFILSLPRGYATDAGEDGARLSGGERQRIALARVLLKDAPILILDEPTANLDALTEQAVWKNIFDTTASRTVLVVSHRLPDAPDEIFHNQLKLGMP